jgi:hypothetical protein
MMPENIVVTLARVDLESAVKAFYLREFRRDPNNLLATQQLTKLTKLDAIKILKSFPQLVSEAAKTKEERMCHEGIRQAFLAKASWLLYWWSEGVGQHPTAINNTYRAFEINARLSQLRWDLILAMRDRILNIKEAFPLVAFPWLLCEMAECIQMQESQATSLRDWYLNWKNFNDDSRDPIEKISGGWQQPDDYLLVHFDKAMETLARELCAVDHAFRIGYWEPYWKMKQRLGSAYKKSKGKIVCSAPPPPKPRGRRKGM